MNWFELFVFLRKGTHRKRRPSNKLEKHLGKKSNIING